MKTIKIQSEFDFIFDAYEVLLVTSKGLERYGFITINKMDAYQTAELQNKKVPYYNEGHECTVYHAFVRDITITI